MAEWISVKRRKPKSGQMVWVACYRNRHKEYVVHEAVYNPDIEDFPFSGDGPSVRYWMPREDKPAPPKFRKESRDGSLD